jgi:hypothetical protein
MQTRRPYSALTTAGTPLVRVEIDTHSWQFGRWEEARKVDPEYMDFAVPIRALPLPDDRMRVEFAVDPSQYSLPDEIALHDFAGFIEMLLDASAGMVLGDEQDDDDQVIDIGPTQPPGDDDIPF